jgi:hypothetical protein
MGVGRILSSSWLAVVLLLEPVVQGCRIQAQWCYMRMLKKKERRMSSTCCSVSAIASPRMPGRKRAAPPDLHALGEADRTQAVRCAAGDTGSNGPDLVVSALSHHLLLHLA